MNEARTVILTISILNNEEHESMLDQYEQEQTVDPIPMQDLNMEAQEEKNKDRTKSNSSTEEKYRADYHKRD
jgi:hypothetical protein